MSGRVEDGESVRGSIRKTWIDGIYILTISMADQRRRRSSAQA